MAASCWPKWKPAGKVALKLDDGSSTDLDREDLQVRLQAKPGWAAAQGKHLRGGVSHRNHAGTCHRRRGPRNCPRHSNLPQKTATAITPTELKSGVVSDSVEIRRAVEQFADYIKGETLATVLQSTALEGVEPTEIKVGDDAMHVYVRIVKK